MSRGTGVRFSLLSELFCSVFTLTVLNYAESLLLPKLRIEHDELLFFLLHLLLALSSILCRPLVLAWGRLLLDGAQLVPPHILLAVYPPALLQLLGRIQLGSIMRHAVEDVKKHLLRKQ